MKKIIFSLCLICSMITFSFADNGKSYKAETAGTEPHLIKVRLTGSVTLSNGCKITYDLVVDYGVVSFSVNGITGTITMSGTCSGSGTIVARAAVNDKKVFTDFEVLSYTGKPNDNLKSEEFRTAMVKKLNEANLFQIGTVDN